MKAPTQIKKILILQMVITPLKQAAVTGGEGISTIAVTQVDYKRVTIKRITP